MTLDKRQIRTLAFGLALAIDYESSLADANHGGDAEIMRKDKGQRAAVMACRRNIRAFERLREQALQELSR